ncbi:MAG: hypothetical protein LM591_01460 [Candidatus Korarchaeum sp.]|nr:hypothetical protein [Candidatus Korarchaeum sp.]
MMNKKAFLVTVILIVIISAVISMEITQIGHSNTQVHNTSPNTSSLIEHDNSTTLSTTGRDAIFIDRKDPKKRLDVPSDAILKIKDKIYALGGYYEGVAVILSEDLRPICHAKLKHELWRAEKYDEDRFVAAESREQVTGIAMFDSELNLIWSVDGNFTDFRVANNKIYAIELKGDYYYLDIFDGNGNLIRSFRVLDANEAIAGRRVSVLDGKIYVTYISGEVTGPYKLMLLRFDEEGNLELKKEIETSEELSGVAHIFSHKNGLLLAVSSSSCRYIYVDKDGNILGEARWKPPFGEGCAAKAKVLNGRAYIFGWDPNLFTGYVGLINESIYAIYLNESIYHAKAQEIFVQRNGTPQGNSQVYDVLLDGDKLYVIGLVQMYPPSGAFIAKVDPYLNADISYLLERADVVYLEDIPPCKS